MEVLMSVTTLRSTLANRSLVGPQPNALEERKSFLTDLKIEHGPIEALGVFFLKADQELRARGLQLSFAPLEELMETNRRNRDSWRPVVPLFDPAQSGCAPKDAFCLLGYNNEGEVVATQAARFYDLSGDTLKECAESLRMFYADAQGAKERGEQCSVTAPKASDLTGRVVFSGAIWYRPDWRGLQLSTIMPRISRAYAHARWNTDYTISFVTRALIDKGVVKRYGYTNIDWSVALRRFPLGDYDGGLLWMDSEQLFSDMSEFMAGKLLPFDRAVNDGGADEHLFAARTR